MSLSAHVFATLVTLPCLLFIIRLVRRGELRSKYAMIWMTVGLGMVALAAWPQLLNEVAIKLGVSYGPAVLFLVAILLLMLLSVHFSWELSRLEERTRVLAEELALARAGIDPIRPEASDGAALEVELQALVAAGALEADHATQLSARVAARRAPAASRR